MAMSKKDLTKHNKTKKAELEKKASSGDVNAQRKLDKLGKKK